MAELKQEKKDLIIQEVEARRDVLVAVSTKNAYNILYTLWKSENALTTSEFVEKLGMFPSTFSQVTKRLRDVGILESNIRDGGEYEYFIALNATPFVQMLFTHCLFEDDTTLEKSTYALA